MLFSDVRRHALSLPAKDKDGNPSTIAYLIDHLCEHVMKDSRKELFVLDGHLYVSSPFPMGDCANHWSAFEHPVLVFLRARCSAL